MKLTQPQRSTRGRPRTFDPERALDQALQVFWSKGYEGTSLSHLTEAMGINRPSLYATFGNKESLFHLALKRYLEKSEHFLRDAVNQPTARAVIEYLLLSSADRLTRPGNPQGCLTVRGALACGEQAEPIRVALAAHRSTREKILRTRLERAAKDGDLPAGTDPADLARFVATVYLGMSVQAAGGATGEGLRRVAELAIRVLPDETKTPVHKTDPAH